ncbi:MAG: pilus assembly protein [Lachnospiraceae bacterium]|nr:pilus assembly protein [Lachnospiraceae bacterium]
MRRNNLKRATFTVEAALIMPVVLMVILSVLYMCMHVHNRNYLKAYAIEQSISGHVQSDPTLLFSSDISANRTDGGNMRTVSYTAGTVYYTGRRLYSISERAGYRKVKPVTYLWRMRSVKRIFGQG